jgi:hypothetical protein
VHAAIPSKTKVPNKIRNAVLEFLIVPLLFSLTADCMLGEKDPRGDVGNILERGHAHYFDVLTREPSLLMRLHWLSRGKQQNPAVLTALHYGPDALLIEHLGHCDAFVFLMGNDMKQCDTLLRGMVITMNSDRDVYTDGYVAISDGRIVETGLSSQCNFKADDEIGGDATDTRFDSPGHHHNHRRSFYACA